MRIIPTGPHFRRPSKRVETLRLRWVAALLVGLLMAVSQPPLTLWWLLPVGIAALYVLWRKAETGRRAFWTGWIAGTAYFAGTLFWIVEPFLVEPEKFAWMIPVALPAMAGGLALFWGLAFVLAWRIARNAWSQPLAFAACWMLAEALRGVVLTGFPWAQPGYSLVNIPPIQVAAFVGINGVTFLVLLCGACIGAVLTQGSKGGRAVYAAIALGIGVGSWGLGAARLAQPIPPRAQPLMVGLVQPNVPQAEKWHPDLRDAQLADLLEKTRELTEKGADVIIWPEAATPFPIAEMPDLRAAISQRLSPNGVLLAGGLRVAGRGTDAQRFHNSLLAVGGDGTLLKSYDKQHLVPFGEYLPFDDILTGMGLRAVISLPGGFSAGADQDRVLKIAGLPPFGVMICYEAIFPHEVIDRNAGIDWLVHVTNDAWFGKVAGPQQHLAQTRVRAIERGVPVARAANTGISAMIDARGRILRALPLNAPGTLLEPLPSQAGKTMYGKHEEAGLVLMFMIVSAFFTILNRHSFCFFYYFK